MLKNLLLTGFRNLWKQKLYTLINLLGLATGIACFVLIGLYVRHQRSFDRGIPTLPMDRQGISESIVRNCI